MLSDGVLFNSFWKLEMQVKNPLARAFIPVAIAMAFAASASADVVDQDFTPGNAGFCGASTCTWQQVVTAGMSGTLTGLKVFAYDGTVDLRIGMGSGPVSSGWSVDMTGVSTTGFIDLSAFNIQLTAGQSFVFDVRNAASGGFQGNYTGGTNPAGQLYGSWSGGSYSSYNGWNLGYVTRMAAPVPEPQTYALMLAGLAAVGFVARRRKVG